MRVGVDGKPLLPPRAGVARYLEGLLRQADLLPLRFWTTGMITQNYTPKCLVPLLKRFDFDFPLGEYHVTVALKRPGKINR